MANQGEYTYSEITSQPQAWTQAIGAVMALKNDVARLWDQHAGKQPLFTGCGSTYYLSLAAAALYQELTGEAARAYPAGELYLYPGLAYEEGRANILVAISRSGTTSETIAAVQRFREAARGPVIVITNYFETPLGKLGDISITIPAGQEVSVAQTRSFASMYLAAALLSAQVAGRDDLVEAMGELPALGKSLIDASRPVARRVGEDLELDRFYFLGSGVRYGLACEANLKMKEMTLTHSEPFHFMEFRHGPMSMVSECSMVIGLLSDAQRLHEQAVLDQMETLGGNILSLAESGAEISFASGLPEAIRNVLYLPPLQLMAYYRALAKGLNPDKPNNLSAVVKLELG